MEVQNPDKYPTNAGFPKGETQEILKVLLYLLKNPHPVVLFLAGGLMID